MPAAKKQFQTMDEYVETCPAEVQKILQKIRRTIRKATPEAVETISYQMPAYKLYGRGLVYFAAWKNHIGMYSIPSGSKTFEKEIAPYKGPKGSLLFPLDQPIPYDLISKIVRLRVKEHGKEEKY